MKSIRITALGIISLYLLTVIASCRRSDADADLPDYVLSRKKMTAVLTDMHLIEAALQQKQTIGLVVLEKANLYYDTLFARHSITRTQLDSSIAWYSRRPEVFEAIYTTVITNLSKKESEIQLKKEEDLPPEPDEGPLPEQPAEPEREPLPPPPFEKRKIV